jgi:hypothetical protein
VDPQHRLGRATDAMEQWAGTFGPYQPHPSLLCGDDRFAAAFAEFTGRLKDNHPFFHPAYVGQMLEPPHPAAVVGCLTAMLINPDNHALDGGPAIAQLAAMFGYDTHPGHLTTSGTIANLEALFVARELHPGQGIAHSQDAHCTHGRMCRVLGVQGHPVPVDDMGRMNLDASEDLLRTGRVGTVVLTAGTTGLGAVDPVHQALALKERHGVRLHVDAAYGGFSTLLAGAGGPEGLPPEPWRAITRCDSVVVDPHKPGLQPYGCDAVLFRDPGWAASTCTTRPTPTSPPPNCTSGRSAWSAHAPAPRPPRCGSPSGSSRPRPPDSAPSSRPAGGPRCDGRS